MSLTRKQLREVWDALRAGQSHRDDALSEVRIRRSDGCGECSARAWVSTRAGSA